MKRRLTEKRKALVWMLRRLDARGKIPLSLVADDFHAMKFLIKCGWMDAHKYLTKEGKRILAKGRKLHTRLRAGIPIENRKSRTKSVDWRAMEWKHSKDGDKSARYVYTKGIAFRSKVDPKVFNAQRMPREQAAILKLLFDKSGKAPGGVRLYPMLYQRPALDAWGAVWLASKDGTHHVAIEERYYDIIQQRTNGDARFYFVPDAKKVRIKIKTRTDKKYNLIGMVAPLLATEDNWPIPDWSSIVWPQK